jgi:hypothetical protein
MTRLTDAWQAMAPEQRLVTVLAGGLFVSMFLPWYSKTDTIVVHDAPKATQTSFTAFGAFSFVEAAVLLVSAAIIVMLVARVEQRDFQLPGGDGLIVMLAGGWTSLLIFYRLLDKPGLKGNDRVTATVGVEWGIFIALLLAIGIIYAGERMRAVEQGSSRLQASTPAAAPDTEPDTSDTAADVTQVVPAGAGRQAPAPGPDEPQSGPSRPRYPPAPSEQMSFEDQPPRSQ